MAEADDVLKRHEKVVAAVPLRGVPAGTPGRVTLVNGMGPWIRYRVLFDNGADRGNLDRSVLVRPAEWPERATAGETGGPVAT